MTMVHHVKQQIWSTLLESKKINLEQFAEKDTYETDFEYFFVNVYRGNGGISEARLLFVDERKLRAEIRAEMVENIEGLFRDKNDDEETDEDEEVSEECKQFVKQYSNLFDKAVDKMISEYSKNSELHLLHRRRDWVREYMSQIFRKFEMFGDE